MISAFTMKDITNNLSATDWVNVFATNKSLVTLLYKKFLKNNKKDNPIGVFLNS